jgi:hypothetical protein
LGVIRWVTSLKKNKKKEKLEEKKRKTIRKTKKKKEKKPNPGEQVMIFSDHRSIIYSSIFSSLTK